MTFIHQSAELLDFLVLTKLCGFTSGFEVMHSFTFCKDMHRSLVKEELCVLSANFLNVGNIVDKLEAVVNVALLLYLSWSVATRSKLLTDDFKHALFVLIKSYF